MAWIESHQAIERHPKTLELMSMMEWDLDTTVGKLHRFWWWCVDYAEDGDLRKHNDAILGGAVALNGSLASGFVEAMVAACWLDREPYFRVHDWWDYIGRFLQVKYKHKPEKWQAVRESYSGNPAENPPLNGSKTHNQPNQPNQPIPNLNLTNQKVKDSVAKSPQQPRFVPPSVEEAEAEFARRGHPGLGAKFVGHYQSQGWKKNNGQKVTDWKACITTWETNGKSGSKAGRTVEQMKADNLRILQESRHG